MEPLAFQSVGSAISRWSAWKEGGTSGKIIEKWMRVPFGIGKSLGVWDGSWPVLDTVAGRPVFLRGEGRREGCFE
jgi:hypothetical protein